METNINAALGLLSVLSMWLHSYIYTLPFTPLHFTPASCPWVQFPTLPTPLCGHSDSLLSFPKHSTCRSHTGPGNKGCVATPFKNPSSLHTTVASLSSHPSSHIVPHTP